MTTNKLLKPGERAAFICDDGRIVIGKIIAVQQNNYLVLGDDAVSGTYSDGLFRFRNYIREDRPE